MSSKPYVPSLNKVLYIDIDQTPCGINLALIIYLNYPSQPEGKTNLLLQLQVTDFTATYHLTH